MRNHSSSLLLISLISWSMVTSLLYSSKSSRLLESYDPMHPKLCRVNSTTLIGRCMFVWDCHRRDGKSLGLCKLDKSIYGSCCYHNGTLNEVTVETDTPVGSGEPDTDYQEGSYNVSAEVTERSTTTTPQFYQCGVSELQTVSATIAALTTKGRNSPEFRIVGGEPATVGQWPWVVSIRRASIFGYTSTHSCGGVVVNENWIVTAAHCVAALSKSLIRVRLGDLDFKSDMDNEKIPFVERKIERKIIYPTYNFSSFENDLSLLKLSEPISYGPNVRPVCLPKERNNDYVGQNATIVGWGRISENGQYSQKQLYVQVPIISNADCVQMFNSSGRDERIPGHFICAGFALGGKDGCQGDSGGPLTVQDSEGKWSLAGIMSWGIGCGEPHQPGVYTRMSLFTDWILQHAI